MKPIGPLMKEHRLIERMVALCHKEATAMKKGKPADGTFIALVVDFFRTYADKTHHGKEEDILFRDLATKEIGKELHNIMEELILDHRKARNVVSSLDKASRAYVKGNAEQRSGVIDSLEMIVAIYPPHIEKEDKQFFYPILGHLTAIEQSTMLTEFQAFDSKMIHQHYSDIIDAIV